MTRLTWDGAGQRRFETGVDHGVLYPMNPDGSYAIGVPWNGLTTVTESPSGAEATPQYADNIQYLNLVSAEKFGFTIEAFTYPDEWEQCDGTATPTPGVSVGQQNRVQFGFSYRTKIGNDTAGQDYGYKLHIAYGGLAAPSEKAFATVNDSPEAIGFSWECTTTPVAVTGLKPAALLTIDSTKVDADALSNLEDILYGTGGEDPRIPLPDEVIAIIEAGAPVAVNTLTVPTYTSGTHTLTIPTLTGVDYYVDGVKKDAGDSVVFTSGQVSRVSAVTQPGYAFNPATVKVTDWQYAY